MEFRLLGRPGDGPALRLDHRSFAYAGKFVMTDTGKATAEEEGEVVAALAFSPDRTDPGVVWIRYVTVRDDRRGEGIGARLAAFAAERLLGDADRLRIAVNNPFAYEALYKAGFCYTGERTGLAELVLARPGDRSPTTYRAGLDAFRGREGLSDAERSFLEERVGADPPVAVSA